ncbi:Ammonium transporter MEP3 [Hypsizygus marmoreus]|uniref:Ammonium transporter n=1 Tax=Hypsizygus marmoreus TaxID=39966 RepID=A0A369K6D6_HYPMA|nr:Ammonium transporter MEP3 [Hypsizygus marmoreus]
MPEVRDALDASPFHHLIRRDVATFDRGDVSFIIVAGAMVFLMIPGLAFLYSGLARRKSALSLIWACFASNAIVIFQWFFWGYSLAFSPTATNGFIGNLKYFGLKGVLGAASPGSPLIPELVYSFFQMEFACVTAAILMGGIAERGRVLPAMVFIFLWVTLVYCPLACWVWGINGWAFKWGVLDFAGGGPVEIASGVGGLAYSWILGRRQEKELLNFRPHNVSMVGLGTSLLWFGWLGFNGGSAFGANLRAVIAIWNTMLAAAFGGVVWCALDYRIERRWTMVGFCSGTIAGLVAATPSSGYLHLWSSVVVGILAGAICNFATKVKFLVRVDDALDLFAEHAVGGIVGLLLNAFFASGSIIALDDVNTTAVGGWLDNNWKQLYIQFAYICATCSYTFVITAVLAKLVDMVPGLHLRSTPEAEKRGMDEMEIGEFASDYIEIRRDFTDGAAPFDSTEGKREFFHPHVAAGDRHGHAENGLTDHHDSDPPQHLETMSEKTENSTVAPPSS